MKRAANCLINSNHEDRFSHAVSLIVVYLLCISLVLIVTPFSAAQTVVTTVSRPNMRPTSVAVYENGNKYFIADKSSKSILVYNGKTDKFLATVKINLSEVHQMIVDEKSGRLFGTGISDTKILVLNTKTNSLIQYLTPPNIQRFPMLAYDPAIHKIYVLYSASFSNGGFVQIDVQSLAMKQLNGINGNINRDMAVNPVTHDVFITNLQYSFLDVVNGVTLKHTKIPNISGVGAGVNYRDNKVYIGYYNNAGKPYRIGVYNCKTGKCKAFDKREDSNDALLFAYNPESNRTYTSSEIVEVISVIEGKTDDIFTMPMKNATATPKIRYETNHVYYVGSDYIGILDDPTQLITTIPIDHKFQGGILIQQLAINQKTGRVYLINDGDNVDYLTVVQDEPVLSRLPVYVGTHWHYGSKNYTHIFDTGSKTYVGVLKNSREVPYHSAAFSPGGGRYYIPVTGFGTGDDGVAVYAGYHDVIDDSKEKIMHKAVGSTAVAVSPSGDEIYVTNNYSDDISVLDAEASAYSHTITAGNFPMGLAVTPDGKNLLVANKDDDNVMIVDTGKTQNKDFIAVGDGPWGIAVNPAGTRAFVANYYDDTVSILNIKKKSLIDTVAVEAGPKWLNCSPDGAYLYVANHDAGSVSVINTNTCKVSKTISLSAAPEGICCLPDGSKVYVGTYSSLVELDTSSYSTKTFKSNFDEPIVSVAVGDPTARIAGVITDSSGPLSKAVIRVYKGKKLYRKGKTNSLGEYCISNLAPGKYDVKVSKSGHKDKRRKKCQAEAGRIFLLNLKLKNK